MVTKYKQFENILYSYRPKNIKVGYYVICSSQTANQETKIFLQNNVGKVVSVTGYPTPYVIQYENVPESCYPCFSNTGLTWVELSGIEQISDNKEELEAMIASKKYNL